MNHAYRCLVFAGLVLCAAPAAATTFTVTNTNDSGAGSLRAAIAAVNADFSGPHRIEFNIPGVGVQTIHLLTKLDAINNPVAIDGTSQPGYNTSAAAPLIELDGTGATVAVVFFAAHSSARGLILNRFPNSALEMFADACTVSACYVGTNATGTAASPNGLVGVYVSGNDVVVGGRQSFTRNIISGNAIGVGFTNVSVNDTLMGNYIGTDVTGTKAIGSSLYGVSTGGAGALDIERNVISGHTLDGIRVEGSIPDPSLATLIYRNMIGTDATGRNKIPNQQSGIRLLAWFTKVGDIGRGNTISGNDQYGIYVDGSLSAVNRILGNKIGVSADGALPLGNGLDGIFLDQSHANTVGNGRIDGSGNLIGANGGNGIKLDGSNAVDNIILGNAIGTSFNGASSFGNAGAGIYANSDRSFIGGAVENANIIANNHGGILVGGTQNTLQGNWIFQNGPLLGIDLLEPATGVTANDSLDGDDGANHLVNYPVLTSVTQVGDQVRLQGRLASEPLKDYIVDFYSSRQCSALGYGEGESWLGAISVSTTAAGNTTFDVSFPLSAVVGYVFTCTATVDPSGSSTSEFSPCGTLAAPTAVDTLPPMSTFALSPSRPSPARERTTVGFLLPARSHVQLQAFDVAGRLVATLVDRDLPAGPQAADWSLHGVRPGRYFCRIDARTLDGSGRGFRATTPVVVLP